MGKFIFGLIIGSAITFGAFVALYGVDSVQDKIADTMQTPTQPGDQNVTGS